MRVWITFVLLVALFIAGLLTGYSYFFRLSYLLSGILVLGLAWARLSLWGLEVKAGRRPQRLRAGSSFNEVIKVYNFSPIPKIGIQLQEESSIAESALTHSLNLAPQTSHSVVLSTPALERGCYSLGPTSVIVSDPFRLFRQKRLVRPASDLIVHPRVFYLPGLLSPKSDLSGDSRSGRRLPYLSPKASDIREYYPGDSLNRIHWPLTARWQKLMVKEFDTDPSHNIWIILDMASSAQRGRGWESTEEYGISIAASLAQHFLRQGFSLGLEAHGDPHLKMLPDRGTRQVIRVMDALANLRARGSVSLLDAINRLERNLSRKDLAVVITPSCEESWLGAIQLLAERGVRTLVVLLEQATFGPGEDSVLVFSSLLASRIPTLLVKKGDSIDMALSQGARAR